MARGTVPRAIVRIVLADDHAVVRGGLRHLLDATNDLEVVAEAGTVQETERQVAGHDPDVLVLDLHFGRESSLPAIPGLVRRTRVVVLTMQDDPVFARRALASGASGFVLKEAAEEALVEAVRVAARGGTYLDPVLGARLAAAPPGPPDGLSPRELAVLRLIGLGHTNAAIAGLVHLSVRTVETHRAAIGRKTGAHTRAELVRYALDHGLLDDR
jgi:two-component system, NarL family, response regulator NreC